MNKFKYLALLFLLCVGGAAFAQGLPGYIYPVMPQIHSAGGVGAAAAATASPTPTPAFVVGASLQSIATANLTLTGCQVGDTVAFMGYSNANLSAISAAANNWIQLWNNAAGGGTAFSIYLKQVTNQDVAASCVFSPFTTFGTASCFSAIDLRHVFYNDGIGTVSNVSSTATVTTNSFTTVTNNDVKIWYVGLQGGSSNHISTPPTGITIPAAAAQSAGASNQGCAIGYNLNVGAAGSIATTNATSSVASNESTFALGLMPYTAGY